MNKLLLKMALAAVCAYDAMIWRKKGAELYPDLIKVHSHAIMPQIQLHRHAVDSRVSLLFPTQVGMKW
jgi:hypothetical protein